MANLEYQELIGAGSFGEVWLARDLGVDALRAVKLVSPSAIPNLAAYNDEARMLNELEHPNVIAVYGTEIGPVSGTTPDVGMYAIVMEYMDGGSLEDALNAGGVDMVQAVSRIADAARGAERAHALGYVHRDVKPGNILISGKRTKLSDFGLCAATYRGVASGAGTLVYVAPEVLQTGLTSFFSDIYSFGATLYELVNGPGSLSWPGDPDDLRYAISRGSYPNRRQYHPGVPKKLQRIINKALHPEQSKRYRSLADFRRAIEAVPILCNWHQKAFGDPEEWLGMSTAGLYKAVVSKRKLEFELLRLKSAPGKFRRVTADCVKVPNSSELLEHQAAVMQRLVESGV